MLMNLIKALVIIANSLSSQSQRLADGIRGHWLIECEGRWCTLCLSNHAVENSLHWGGTDGESASPYGVPFKDVIYEEDISEQKAGFAPRNLSVIKTWVLTLLRTHGFDSINLIQLKGQEREMSHNIGYILTFWT